MIAGTFVIGHAEKVHLVCAGLASDYELEFSGGDNVIKHIVMWDVRGETSEQKQEAASLVQASFEQLRGQVPGLMHLEVGIDFSNESHACDVVLYSEFKDRASLDAYARDPAHLKVRRELEGVRIARHQVDYVHEK